jgi:uncharacterized protein YeaC (DUF1315 family)
MVSPKRNLTNEIYSELTFQPKINKSPQNNKLAERRYQKDLTLQLSSEPLL